MPQKFHCLCTSLLTYREANSHFNLKFFVIFIKTVKRGTNLFQKGENSQIQPPDHNKSKQKSLGYFTKPPYNNFQSVQIQMSLKLSILYVELSVTKPCKIVVSTSPSSLCFYAAYISSFLFYSSLSYQSCIYPAQYTEKQKKESEHLRKNFPKLLTDAPARKTGVNKATIHQSSGEKIICLNCSKEDSLRNLCNSKGNRTMNQIKQNFFQLIKFQKFIEDMILIQPQSIERGKDHLLTSLLISESEN